MIKLHEIKLIKLIYPIKKTSNKSTLGEISHTQEQPKVYHNINTNQNAGIHNIATSILKAHAIFPRLKKNSTFLKLLQLDIQITCSFKQKLINFKLCFHNGDPKNNFHLLVISFFPASFITNFHFNSHSFSCHYKTKLLLNMQWPK